MNKTELAIKELLNHLNNTTDKELEPCRTCYLKNTYGSQDRPLRIRKLITELLQEDIDATISIDTGNQILPLSEIGYMTRKRKKIILSAKYHTAGGKKQYAITIQR